jgi:drug/metabolite transporter (DMT)-like permease
MLLLAIIPQLMGHSTFNWALKHLSASYVSIALLAEPVSATIMAYFLLAETPTWLKIGGAVFILLGIALATWSSQKNGSVEE